MQLATFFWTQAVGWLGLAIAISSSGYRFVLDERTEEELEVTLDELPPGTRLLRLVFLW
ncbi:MAG: hypothetical protein ACFBSC_13585 [Microcoleaceae cyanobacterium]